MRSFIYLSKSAVTLSNASNSTSSVGVSTGAVSENSPPGRSPSLPVYIQVSNRPRAEIAFCGFLIANLDSVNGLGVII